MYDAGVAFGRPEPEPEPECTLSPHIQAFFPTFFFQKPSSVDALESVNYEAACPAPAPALLGTGRCVHAQPTRLE